MGKIRLYIDHRFDPGQPVPLDTDQSHYLSTVMRLSPGAEIAVFNGRQGEWTARLVQAAKRGGAVELVAHARTHGLNEKPQRLSLDGGMALDPQDLLRLAAEGTCMILPPDRIHRPRSPPRPGAHEKRTNCTSDPPD